MSDISFLCQPFIPEEPDIFDKFLKLSNGFEFKVVINFPRCWNLSRFFSTLVENGSQDIFSY